MTNYAENFKSYITDNARDRIGFKPKEIDLIVAKLNNLQLVDEYQDK